MNAAADAMTSQLTASQGSWRLQPLEVPVEVQKQLNLCQVAVGAVQATRRRRRCAHLTARADASTGYVYVRLINYCFINMVIKYSLHIHVGTRDDDYVAMYAGW